MRISDWSSDVCSSDLLVALLQRCDGQSAALLEAWLDRTQPADWREQAAAMAAGDASAGRDGEIGRASCRERVCQYVSISVGVVSLKKQKIIVYSSLIV